MGTESADTRYRALDTWNHEDLLGALVDDNAAALQAVKQALPSLSEAAREIEARLAGGGRLLYAGAGTSGRLAVQDAAELLPTFGFSATRVFLAGGKDAQERAQEGAEDNQEAAERDLAEAAVNARDALIAIAASGRTPYTLAALRDAKSKGALTVGMANNPGAPLLLEADIAVLLDTGPEVLAGSTRLAAGTAQKVALNALSTSVMVRLGGAFDNLMVGMQVTNEKLRRRARAMVCEVASCSESEAEQALAQAAWQIREAIVMLKAGVDLKEAQRLLQSHHQRVRDALTAAEAKAS